jgi:catechol 2,3-dioxygenase-like lactoylglutathione lyase family enzyme
VRPGAVVDHLWIRVRDLDASTAFYEALAGCTGLRRGTREAGRRQFRGAWGTFSLLADGQPVTENLHLAFPAPNRRTVDAFHATALAAGYRSNGEPGERPHDGAGYYAAYVIDPDGHNIESVCRASAGT